MHRQGAQKRREGGQGHKASGTIHLTPSWFSTDALSSNSTSLTSARKRRLDKSTIQAVIEQIEYLRANERGKAKIVRLDEHDRLFVDQYVLLFLLSKIRSTQLFLSPPRDDWLEELPPRWPIETEVKNGKDVVIEDDKLEQ